VNELYKEPVDGEFLRARRGACASRFWDLTVVCENPANHIPVNFHPEGVRNLLDDAWAEELADDLRHAEPK
jgi:hypothetical protein